MEHGTANNDQLSNHEAYDLGYEDVELVHQIVKTDDETPEQNELRRQHNLVKRRTDEMDADSLRDYANGMRGWLWDHLW